MKKKYYQENSATYPLGVKKKKYYHEIKSLYFQVATHVLVESFHLIPGTQVSWGKTLGWEKVLEEQIR